MMTLENRPAMQSATSESACLPRQTLQEYLSGWTPEDRSLQIEQHLADCPECEQTVRELETEPDMLLESLRDPAGDTNKSQESAAERVEEDEPVAKAVQRAKLLMDEPAAPAGEAWQPPAEDLGAYELLRPLGQGGMGAVYLARHRQLGKLVAIKLLPATSAENQDALARFQREVRAAGRLHHPTIVAATDAGTQQGTHYLVMEFVDGMDLSHLARHLGKLPLSEACELARQTALGLSHAHAEGIVHRDIKPSNLMLDETGHIKILDFGLAQLSFWDEAAVELTTVGQLMGTLDYMAPEQAERCGSVDYRVDLYGLGAMLFRLLCGRAPLAATPNQSPLEKLQLLARHQAPRLDTFRPDAPAPLVHLVSELLAREPQDRPASAAHVAERLAEFTDSADLAGLLAKAQATAQEDAGHSKSGEAVGPRLVPAHAAAIAAQGSSGGRRSRWWWLLAAAALPLLVLAGVLIVLETQKGQLVIESEVADVRVKVLKDGQTVRDLEIHPGATSSRLRADQYEIVIDSPSDSLSIDKERFSLRSGQTIVARIHERPAARTDRKRGEEDVMMPAGRGGERIMGMEMMGEPAGGSGEFGMGEGKTAEEPLYDGQPLSHWLETLRRERRPQSIGQSLVAIRAMVSPSTADRITKALVDTMPRLDGNLKIPASESSVFSVDTMGFGILGKANPGQAYFELLVQELKRGNNPWSERILTTGFVRGGNVSSLEEAEPLVDWLDKHVLTDSSEDSPSSAVVEAAQWAIFRLLVDLHTRETAELRQASIDRLVRILETSPRIGLDFWLSQPTSDDLPMKLRGAVVGRSAKALADIETPPALVAQAAMILAGESQLALEVAPGLPATLNARLSELAENPERMLARVAVTFSFRELSVPRMTSTAIGFSSKAPAHASETLEILDLAKVLPANVDLKAGLEAIMKATSEGNEMVSEHMPSAPANPIAPARVQVEWPSLRVAATTGGRGHRFTELFELSPEDWMAYLIYSSASAVANTDREIDLP